MTSQGQIVFALIDLVVLGLGTAAFGDGFVDVGGHDSGGLVDYG